MATSRGRVYSGLQIGILCHSAETCERGEEGLNVIPGKIHQYMYAVHPCTISNIEVHLVKAWSCEPPAKLVFCCFWSSISRDLWNGRSLRPCHHRRNTICTAYIWYICMCIFYYWRFIVDGDGILSLLHNTHRLELLKSGFSLLQWLWDFLFLLYQIFIVINPCWPFMRVKPLELSNM